MKVQDTSFYLNLVQAVVMLWLVGLLASCRSIPCFSIDALGASFDVFWEDHSDMLQRDETLSTEEKGIVLETALKHKRLIAELQKLCGGE